MVAGLTAVFLLLLLGEISDVSAVTELRGEDGLIIDGNYGTVDITGDQGVGIDTSMGDVSVTAGSGSVDISGQTAVDVTSSGDIGISGNIGVIISGETGVDVTSGSGGVGVSGFSGVNIDATAGGVVVNAGEGDIDIDAQGGISMDAATGDVIVQGINIGAIDGRFNAVLNGLQATVDLMTQAESGEGSLPSLTTVSSNTWSFDVPLETAPIGDYAAEVSCPTSCYLTMTVNSHVNAYTMASDVSMILMFFVDDINVSQDRAGREYAFHTYGTSSGGGWAPCNFVQMAGPFSAGDHQVVLQGKGGADGWMLNGGFIEIMATRA